MKRMIPIAALFLVCLLPASPQETSIPASGLQISIGTEQINPGIEGMTKNLRVIDLTITNTGDSPRSLLVGENYNNADHWNVTAKLMSGDGQIVTLDRLPRTIVITGVPPSPIVIEIAPHGSYRALLDAENFEERIGEGSTNLAGIIGASGDRLQIILHCGADRFPANFPAQNYWKGDLVSEWLGI